MPQFPKPFFRKPRKRWYVQIDGHQYNLGPDRAKAFELYHQLMQARGRQIEVRTAPGCVTLLEVLDRHLDHLKEKRAPATAKLHEYIYGLVLDKFGRQSLAEQFDDEALRDWADAGNWSTTTRRGYIGAVLTAFRWAASRKPPLIKVNPLAYLTRPPKRSRDVLVEFSQYAAMLDATPDQEFRDVLTVLWETGCRPAELRAVESRHVDLGNGWWKFDAREQKTGEATGDPRIVFLTDVALAITQRLVEASQSGPLFRNTDGQPWKKNAFNGRFVRLRAKLKLPRGVCAYAFRHTFATDSLERGDSPEDLRHLMGHKDLKMITEHYSHLAKRRVHLREVARRARRAS